MDCFLAEMLGMQFIREINQRLGWILAGENNQTQSMNVFCIFFKVDIASIS